MSPPTADDDWMAQFYAEHAPAILAYARRRLESAEDAEDVVVEVFATAWRRRCDLPPTPRPWLYATAAHVISHIIRGRARQSRLGVRLAAVRSLPVADPADSGNVSGELVSLALAELSPADAELLRLWAWEQLEPVEIAAVLGCAPGTARTRLHRARTRLRESLARLGVGQAPQLSATAQSEEPR